MSCFTQYKLKDGRRIRGRYDSKSTKVCISRLDLEKLIYEANVAYEQAEQLQTIIENLAEIKRQAITKVLDEIRAEIEEYEADCNYHLSEEDNCRTCNKITFRSIYRIINKYKAESEE